MAFDDGKRDKSFEQKLDDADLEDQLSQPYTAGPFTPAPVDHDPGRMRNTAFFSKMYGGTADEVRKHLTSVPWPPSHPQGQLPVTTINGVDRALTLVASEVEKLSPAIVALVGKPSGGFNFRAVRGTERLSAHAFGAAVDVGVAVSDYWLWQKPGPDGLLVPKNRMPMEVVEAFERHGFIWGGRWYHYDTMHFEYRPELLLDASSSAGPTR